MSLSDREGVRSKLMTGEGSQDTGYLTELDLTYLARCMAVIGSGTYELNKVPQEQIVVLLSVLRDAKEKGADWARIYSAIYHLWAARRPLLPSPEDMTRQLDSAQSNT
jgi:hypothetical protein